MTVELDELALKYGTDKASDGHGYTRRYAQYFDWLRDRPIRLLELGVGGHEDPDRGGASLRMWREYFPDALVVGVDNEVKDFTIPGVTIAVGSQGDGEFLTALSDKHGPWDVIVDDASHLSSLTIRSWEILYRHLAPGGVYVVEDTHAAYHSHFYGSEEACSDPDGVTMFGAPTVMQYLKRLVDEAQFDPNARKKNTSLFPQRYWNGYHLESVQFFYDICFIVKAH